MSNQLPIYSHVVPKSQYRKQSGKGSTKERTANVARNDFDPLNYNHGGQFHLFNNPDEPKQERTAEKKESRRSKDESRSRRSKVDPGEGKVEAYLRQNQVSIRQQQYQHRHSAVKQAEHRVNLRSLPLNDVVASLSHDRTPTDRHRGFPERERDAAREHRRERDKERERDADGSLLSPGSQRHESRVRKSTSSQKMTEPVILSDKRRFFCREWAFQKIAHCLEQRPVSKTCGALVLGEAGSGKTALCQELSDPGQGPQARQQRALNRRLLARHFLQDGQESSLRPGEFIRSLAMQILSQSSRHSRQSGKEDPAEKTVTPDTDRINLYEEERQVRLMRRLRDSGDDLEESSKPLLGDSDGMMVEMIAHTSGDQRSDDEDDVRTRTIDRIHEREAYLDSMIDDAQLSKGDELPEIMPRTAPKTTNPFLTDEPSDTKIYENHENVFLRNLSQRQSKEVRDSRLIRQSSEPSTGNKIQAVKKSHSEEQKTDSENERSKFEHSPPKSRIPVAAFHYPNKSELKDCASPAKVKSEEKKEETPEYQNIIQPVSKEELEMARLLERKKAVNDEVPPPIPSLPVNPRTLIANAYYEKLLADSEIQKALLPQNLEANPDECFKRALLFPLLEIDPPKQCLFLLVDAIDEGTSLGLSKESSTDTSTTVASMLARHQHLLPQWLLLVCTARRHSKHLIKIFTGFRKIVLDELQRGHVSADVQRYVLARLDSEPRLRARVSSDSTAAAAAAAALDHLRIKSDGCLLYLEKVLDGVADGFIALREIKEIPGTLNGLYLWLAQRLFHGRRFNKVRLLLDVLLVARCGVTEEMLYRCLLTKEYSVSREDFNRRLHLLRRILIKEVGTGHLSLFHTSFSRWLCDVKHCTLRYLCTPSDGHATLAMYYTLYAKRLTAMEIHNYVYHMTNLEQHLMAQKKNKTNEKTEEGPLDLHTLILLWVLDSGCQVEMLLKKETETKKTDNEATTENVTITETKDDEAPPTVVENNNCIDASTPPPLEKLVPSLASRPTAACGRDASVLRALLELCAPDSLHNQQLMAPEQEADVKEEEKVEPEKAEEPAVVDPDVIFELAANGDEDTLIQILKRQPELCSVRDARGGSALHLAARSGHAALVGSLLELGLDVDAPDADGWTPLRAAAWAGHTQVVKVLLENNCDVDAVDADNRTALRAAAWSGHACTVAALLAAGAAPSLTDSQGRAPLAAAAYMAHETVVRALLDAGATTDHQDHDGRTALSVACACAAGAGCVSALLERGADTSLADRDGVAPLAAAAAEGHAEICELLLEAEAEPERVDNCGRTALWAAAAAGHARTVRLLLFWGACVDNMDPEGRTVLSVAAAQGNVEVVRQLLDRGLDEHHRDNSGWTPLHYAAFEGHLEVCSLLLEAGAKVEETDNEGKAALSLAAQEGHAPLVHALVDRWGAAVDQRAHDGKTPLRLAALEGHFECVRALVSRGADVEARDADRRSALYVLALDNRLAMARYLLSECGANVDSRDSEGRTPLHVSAWQGHTDMVNLLITVGGAEIDGLDRCARTALHAAAWRGRAGVLHALLRHGAAPSAVCTQGATPLGIAAQEGHEECVLWLLQYGADPLQADHCGRTPAAVAWRAGHTNICRLLERWTSTNNAPSAPTERLIRSSPDQKRRSVHSSNSTKSSSNMTAGSNRSHHDTNDVDTQDKSIRANMSLSFAQHITRGARREKERDIAIPEENVVEKADAKLRSYQANERDGDISKHRRERDGRRDARHRMSEESLSPLYVSPPASVKDFSQPASLTQPVVTDQHFNRDTHMRIILGREKPPPERNDSKSKRNGIVTNPAMRLVNNVKNGLDNAAANIRRTGVALAASASSNNPAVKTNAFQWRRETPL